MKIAAPLAYEATALDGLEALFEKAKDTIQVRNFLGHYSINLEFILSLFSSSITSVLRRINASNSTRFVLNRIAL